METNRGDATATPWRRRGYDVDIQWRHVARLRYGPRFGAGRRVGVFRRAGLVSFCVDGRDLGAAFERVPSNARPFVRFPTGGAAGEGDAVRLAEAGALCHVDAGAPPPGPLDGRLVVQQFGPELDDWLSLRVAPTATACAVNDTGLSGTVTFGSRAGDR